jgi:hypothetical protein
LWLQLSPQWDSRTVFAIASIALALCGGSGGCGGAAVLICRRWIDPHVIEPFPGWLKVAAAVQTGAGIVLLFLFGLALRNRFRIK